MLAYILKSLGYKVYMVYAHFFSAENLYNSLIIESIMNTSDSYKIVLGQD